MKTDENMTKSVTPLVDGRNFLVRIQRVTLLVIFSSVFEGHMTLTYFLIGGLIF